MPGNPYMLGTLMPILRRKPVIVPLLPSRRIQEYAPMNGADMEDTNINERTTLVPLMLMVATI